MARRGRQGGHGQSQREDGTLEAILTAACEIASEEGLEQLSMRRLATAVGMSKSGLYQHFASKEELQLAAIGRVREVFEARVVCEPAGNMDGGLGALLERWLGFFEDRVFPGGCFLITSAVAFASRSVSVPDALAAGIGRELDVLEAAIERANQTGELNPRRDPGQTAFELHSILMNAHGLFQVTADPIVFGRARTAIHRLLG